MFSIVYVHTHIIFSLRKKTNETENLFIYLHDKH